MEPIAIIGAGPGGLVAARYLKSQGFAPKIFESHSEPGGQWSVSNPNSGVWPDMVTNTFLEATRFSDIPYPPETPIYPHNAEVLAYMRRYAQAFGVLEGAEFNCRLTRLEKDPDGYCLTLERDGVSRRELFSKVVVATGRFNRPSIPPIPGQDRFTGEMGLIHTFDYKDPHAYRGKNVIVAGGAISGLEIASDLSMLGAKSVWLSQRRQRYVNPKMVTGIPLEYYAFTYERAVLTLGEDKAALAENDKALVMKYAGDPSRYGAPKPHPEFSKAGVTGSQHYLNLVAEGRVKPKPWFSDIDGRKVTFTDGSMVEADGIIAGTGFALDLPFLSEDIRDTVDATAAGLQLDEFTFHPDLPGLAFVGLWVQQGSYPVPLEQQARYVAYTWSGTISPRSEGQMRAGLLACEAEGHRSGYRRQNEMALRFARLCGTDPLHRIPDGLDQKLQTSATTGVLYRMVGPDAQPDAVTEFLAQYEKYGPAH